MRALLRLTLLSLTVGAAYALRGRDWISRWGATDAETVRQLPGDTLVPEPELQSTRAVTIAAPVERVFPWLVQLGQGRGGFYSYDRLENRIGLDIHSADRVLPEFQDVEVGDEIAMAPGPPFFGFLVAEVTPPTALVLEMRIHPFTGLQLRPEAAATGPSVHASWAFALDSVGDGTMRLIARSRARVQLAPPLGLLYRLALEAIEFVMERRMLLGIRERAERVETSSVAGDLWHMPRSGVQSAEPVLTAPSIT